MEDSSKKNVIMPLDSFIASTNELKELIKKYPTYPIVVLCNSDVVREDYGWYWFAPKVRFSIGEILDCEQDINDEKVYTRRDDFEEDVRYMVESYDNLEEMTDEEFEQEVQKVVRKYEPYWKNVIQITADI